MRLLIPAGLMGLSLLVGTATGQSRLPTIMTGGNSLNSPGSNLFNITVLNKGGIVITSLEVNCENTRNGPVGSKFRIEVFLTKKGGTYLGNQNKPGPWTLMATGEAKSLAQGTPTPVDITDLFVPPGQYGMAIHYAIPQGSSGTAFAYTNGNGSNQVYKNADLQLNLGSSSTGKFGASVFNPRVWNGAILYEAAKTAAFGTFGAGCDGGSKTGVPTLKGGAKQAVPKLNTNFELEFGNLGTTPSSALLFVGLNFEKWGATNLPMDLGVMGLTGCTLYTSPDVTLGFAHTGKTATLKLFVLPIPTLVGTPIGFQGAFLDRTAAPTNTTVTNLAAGRIGN